MKYLKKKKKSPLISIVCILGFLLLAALLVLTLLPGHSDHGDDPVQTRPQTGTQPVQTTAPSNGATGPAPTISQSQQYVPIETPYCILNFPKQWENYLDVTVTEDTPCRAIFSCKFSENRVFPLFEIGFDSPDGQIQGAVTTDGVNSVKVSYLPYERADQSKMSDEEWAIYTAMEACATDLIGRIPFANELHSGDVEDVVIETPYKNLTFPGRWADYLEVKTDESGDYTLHFHAGFPDGESVRLFSLTFSRENTKGVPCQMADGTKFWVIVDKADLMEQEIRQDRLSIALQMQEQLRTVMESLNK